MKPEECTHGVAVDFIGDHFPGFTGGVIVGRPFVPLPDLEPDVWAVGVRPDGPDPHLVFPIFLKDLQKRKRISKEDFTARVLTSLPDTISEADLVLVKMTIGQLYDKQWVVNEVIKFCSYIEEVNPHIPEAHALRQMDLITQRVEKRLSEVKP